MMRILNVLVIAALVAAAGYVYRIKFEATQQAEHAAKLRREIARERDSIATLRAEWTKLDNPERIQGLAQRHLTLKPVESIQYVDFAKLPEMRPQIVPPGTADPIAAIIEMTADPDAVTSSIPQASGSTMPPAGVLTTPTGVLTPPAPGALAPAPGALAPAQR